MRRALALLFVGSVLVVACRKTPQPSSLPPKCEKDADCTFTSATRGQCCVNPCGGYGTVVHVEEAAAISKYNASYCTKERVAECPQAGGCAQPAPLRGPPRCRAGACVEDAPPGASSVN